MSSIFSKIVDGTIPAYKVAEDDRFLAFLDINPLTKGHTLVIPKQETDYLFDLDEALFTDLQRFAYKVSKGIKAATGCERVGVCVIGFEVPHAHVHLIPMNEMADMDFRRPKLKLSAEEFTEIATQIKEKL